MQRSAVIACLFALTACSCNKPDRITGNLSSGDVVRITEMVQQDVAKRNWEFERIKTIDETNGTVVIWYADKHARWGEAGYQLERVTNDWKLSALLFR